MSRVFVWPWIHLVEWSHRIAVAARPALSDLFEDLVHVLEHLLGAMGAQRFRVRVAPGDGAEGDSFLACRFQVPDLVSDADRFGRGDAAAAQHRSELRAFPEHRDPAP